MEILNKKANEGAFYHTHSFYAAQIADLIEKQVTDILYHKGLNAGLSKQLERIDILLPDNYSESKDWKWGCTDDRVEWLKLMLQNKHDEIEHQQQLIEQHAAFTKQLMTSWQNVCDGLVAANMRIEQLKHPKYYCKSCCEKRGEIYFEDLYTEE